MKPSTPSLTELLGPKKDAATSAAAGVALLASLVDLREVLEALPNSREELEKIVDQARQLLADMDAKLASSQAELAGLVAQEMRANWTAARASLAAAEDRAERAAGQVDASVERAVSRVDETVEAAARQVEGQEERLRERLAELDTMLAVLSSSDLVKQTDVENMRALIEEQVRQVTDEFTRVREQLDRALEDVRSNVDRRIQGIRSSPPTPTKVYQNGVLKGERRGIDFTSATVTDNGRDRITVDYSGTYAALYQAPFLTSVIGSYYGSPGGSMNTAAPTLNELRLTPITFRRQVTLDQIGVNVTVAAASSTVRLGLFVADETNLIPGTLLFDAGTVDTTTTGTKVISINQVVPAGHYWLAAVAQGGTPTLRTIQTSNMIGVGSTSSDFNAAHVGLIKSAVSGALATLASVDGPTSVAPRVMVRVSA